MSPRHCCPLILALFVVLAGCADETPPSAEADRVRGGTEATVPAAEREALTRARDAADALGGALMKQLLATLAAEGPGAAVRVCSDVAQSIAAEHGSDGLQVRRVTLRERNPADRPDPFERERLEQLEQLHAAGQLPKEVIEIVERDEAGQPDDGGEDAGRVEAGGRVLRYMRPIVLMQPCLQCHGEPAEMNPQVLRVIDERYPDDRARGYRDGDLRGAVSVTVDLR